MSHLNPSNDRILTTEVDQAYLLLTFVAQQLSLLFVMISTHCLYLVVKPHLNVIICSLVRHGAYLTLNAEVMEQSWAGNVATHLPVV